MSAVGLFEFELDGAARSVWRVTFEPGLSVADFADELARRIVVRCVASSALPPSTAKRSSNADAVCLAVVGDDGRWTVRSQPSGRALADAPDVGELARSVATIVLNLERSASSDAWFHLEMIDCRNGTVTVRPRSAGRLFVADGSSGGWPFRVDPDRHRVQRFGTAEWCPAHLDLDGRSARDASAVLDASLELCAPAGAASRTVLDGSDPRVGRAVAAVAWLLGRGRHRQTWAVRECPVGLRLTDGSSTIDVPLVRDADRPVVPADQPVVWSRAELASEPLRSWLDSSAGRAVWSTPDDAVPLLGSTSSGFDGGRARWTWSEWQRTTVDLSDSARFLTSVESPVGAGPSETSWMPEGLGRSVVVADAPMAPAVTVAGSRPGRCLVALGVTSWFIDSDERRWRAVADEVGRLVGLVAGGEHPTRRCLDGDEPGAARESHDAVQRRQHVLDGFIGRCGGDLSIGSASWSVKVGHGWARADRCVVSIERPTSVELEAVIGRLGFPGPPRPAVTDVERDTEVLLGFDGSDPNRRVKLYRAGITSPVWEAMAAAYGWPGAAGPPPEIVGIKWNGDGGRELTAYRAGDVEDRRRIDQAVAAVDRRWMLLPRLFGAVTDPFAVGAGQAERSLCAVVGQGGRRSVDLAIRLPRSVDAVTPTLRWLADWLDLDAAGVSALSSVAGDGLARIIVGVDRHGVPFATFYGGPTAAGVGHRSTTG